MVVGFDLGANNEIPSLHHTNFSAEYSRHCAGSNAGLATIGRVGGPATSAATDHLDDLADSNQ